MIETLARVAKELLKYEAKKEGISEDLIALNHFCVDPHKGREEVKVLFVDLENNELHLNDYKDKERWKYLYTLTTGKQAIGLSWVVDLRKKEKETEIQKGIKEIRIGLNKLKDRVEDKVGRVWVENCLERISLEDEKLAKGIQDKANGTKVLLVIQLPERCGEGIRKAFIKERILGEKRAESSGRGVCGVCGKEAEVRPSIYLPFFTVEKRGFAPMGSNAETWKYAPLCEDCVKLLCIAGDYLDSHLRTYVVGKRAYLIPNLELQISKWPQKFIHYLWEFRERSSGRTVPDLEEFPQSDEEGSLLEGIEGLIGEWDGTGPPPFRSISLAFHERQQQKVVFLYTTSGILPKQLKEASERLRKLRMSLINGILGKPGEKIAGELKIAGSPKKGGDFNFLRHAWRWGGDEPAPLALNAMLLVESLLTQSPPPANIFWSDVDKILRRLYLDTIGRKAQQTVKQILSDRIALIWAIWSLLYGNKNGGGEMQKVTPFQGVKISQDFWEKFFEEKRMLNTNAKRGLFLIGVLFGEVEYQQREDRKTPEGKWPEGEMPILSYLRGLTISAEELKRRLFPQLIMRLRQLSAYSLALSEVESAASYYTSCAEGTSDEEARFVFCLGWALSRHTLNSIWEVLPSKEKEIEEEEE